MDNNILMWVGYAASGVIALSMTMNSIVKFRWINLVGASTFATYGFLIGAFPVSLLNSFIVMVDIYYLTQIYSKSHLFDTLEIRGDNKYLLKFLEFHNDDIQEFLPGFKYKPKMNSISFFVLRNTAVAGIFLAHRENDNELKVGLDFVVPEYRDYKNGKFIYIRLKDFFLREGFHKVVAEGGTKKHSRYLKRIGFKESANGLYIKEF